MLFQPSNIIPSYLSGDMNGIIYNDDSVNISWQVNGSTPITAVNFHIIALNSDGTTIDYGWTKKYTLPSPFYGTDAKGNPVRFQYSPGVSWENLFTAEPFIAPGGDYYIYIRQYYNIEYVGSSVEAYLDSSSPALVKCLERAYLNVSLVDKNGGYQPSATSPILFFEASLGRGLTIDDPSQVASARWQVVLDDEIIEDTGVLSTNVLNYQLNGALSGKTYRINCTVTTIYGETITSSEVVDVSYTEEFDDEAIQFYFDPTDSSYFIAISFGMIGRIPYLYRKDDKKLKFIADISTSTHSFFRDYGVKSGSPVQYEVVFYNPSTGESNSRISNVACFQFRGYYLIEASQDENDSTVYHVVKTWRFSNNLSVGSVTNNNSPSWLTNFTGYRFRQPTSRIGKSGTLQALLSNVDMNTCAYKDTPSMQEELYSASLSNNTFFLKDMKGNLYMVGISGPITQTINIQSKVQQVTVSVPWEEVGDASQISLVQTLSDEGWRDNQISQVTLSVDVETGVLSAQYPYPYYGTTFAMQNGNLLANTPDTIPTNQEIYLENGSVIVNSLS